jgi:hypothetical protein
MATVQWAQKECDVTGLRKDVGSYQIVVQEVDLLTPPAPEVTINVDLAPKALKRLLKFIDRGTTSGKRKKSEPTAV